MRDNRGTWPEGKGEQVALADIAEILFRLLFDIV